VQQPIFALLPIATAKADFCTRSCPLISEKRTGAVQLGMSALGQSRHLCFYKCEAASYSMGGDHKLRPLRPR
jgi:hypothetical protein